MSRAKFLATLHAARRGAEFTCPATGLTVHIRAPSEGEKQAAHAAVDHAWAKRELTQLNITGYYADITRELLAVTATVAGELLGDAVRDLDEVTFARYEEELDALRDRVESLTDAEVDAALAEIKKKHQTGDEPLNDYGSGKLRALLRGLVDRHISSPTSS